MEHDRRLGLEEEAAQEYKRRLNQRDARKVIEHQMLEKERQKFFQGEEVRAAPVPCSLFTRAAPLPPPPPPLSAWCMVHGGTYAWLIMWGCAGGPHVCETHESHTAHSLGGVPGGGPAHVRPSEGRLS